MKIKKQSRREFIKDSASTAAAGALRLGSSSRLFAEEGTKKSRVVLIRDKNAVDKKYNVSSVVVEKMVDDAVMALTGKKDAVSAWKQLVKPNDIVGIKSNEWSNLPTPKVLEETIKKRLVSAGVKAENIAIGDRRILRDPVFKKATALINVRPMRAHHWSGMGTLIKNYIMFDKKPSCYHPDSCADLAGAWLLPMTKGKTRLNVLVMLTPLFHGVGPHNFSPQYLWSYNGLLVGKDPVAVDAIGLRIMEAKRRAHFGEERPINPPPKHVKMADTRHGLGTADPDKIELVSLGWGEDRLI